MDTLKIIDEIMNKGIGVFLRTLKIVFLTPLHPCEPLCRRGNSISNIPTILQKQLKEIFSPSHAYKEITVIDLVLYI